MTDKSGKLADDTTPLVGIDDTNAQTEVERPTERGQSFGSVLLNTATGNEEDEARNPDADGDTTDSSQA